MAREEKNWRELCLAIASEQDSEKLADLGQRLLALLENSKPEDSLGAFGIAPDSDAESEFNQQH